MYGFALAAIVAVISVPFSVTHAWGSQQYQQYWCGSYYSYTPCQQAAYQPYQPAQQYSQPSYTAYPQQAMQYTPSYMPAYSTPSYYYSPSYGNNYGYGAGYGAQQYYPQPQYQQPVYPQARYMPSYSGVGGTCDVGANGLWSAQSVGQCQGYVNAYLNQGGY